MTNHQFRINLDKSLFETLREAARIQDISINELIVGVLADKFGDGASRIIIGWVKLDRWGEIDHHKEEPAECPGCGQDMDSANAYVGLVQTGGFYGPVCGGCAISE